VVAMKGGEIGMGYTEFGVFVTRKSYLCNAYTLTRLGELIIETCPKIESLEEFCVRLSPDNGKPYGYYLKGAWYEGE